MRSEERKGRGAGQEYYSGGMVWMRPTPFGVKCRISGSAVSRLGGIQREKEIKEKSRN